MPHLAVAKLAAVVTLLEPQADIRMQFALLPLEQAKHHPASSFSNRMAAHRLRIIGTESVATAAFRTSNTRLLRTTLDNVALLREQAFSSSSSLPASGLEAIGGIRNLRGKGARIPGEVGETSYDYYLRHLQIELKNAPESGLRPFKRNQIDLLATAIHMFWPDQIIAKMKDIEAQYDETLEPLAMARYDLTMLLLAQRIAELEGRTVRSMSDLVPTYLATPLNDPYTGAPYRFSVATRQFYSEGSDGDQSAKPFNYETHTGDITVPNFAQTTSTVAAILQGF